MPTPLSIIHLDLDAFFCAVEEQRDPRLRGKPFAVGGSPDGRGVVASCSYAARQYGVHSAMPMARAVQICPGLKVVSTRHSAYKVASRKVMTRLRVLTSQVEQLSIDEAFLDVSDLPENAVLIGRKLQTEIRADLGLPCSLGIASNKLVAKIANDVGKAAAKGGTPPNALTVVPPGDEAEFLAPLPVEMLWGVGPKTAQKLARMGVETIGDLAYIPEIQLEKRLGKFGWDLARRAKGIDNRPIVTEREAKSFSRENTFSHDTSDGEVLRNLLREQAQDVTRRLRKHERTARTVNIKIRWPDFTTLTRQTTLDRPTADEGVIADTAIQLFEQVWRSGRAVRLLGMGVSNIGEQPRQLGLWDQDVKKERNLQDTIVELQQRFGEDAIWRGLERRE
ncbi:MAG: DNA polymerase IV [Chloroflexota bacterium]|nr:DNA polymerase IV [Chloroflexota bacterium]